MLKVLKYDWKNGWNSVKLLLIAAAVISVLAGLIFGLQGGQPDISESSFIIVFQEEMGRAAAVSFIVWFSVMTALFVLTVLAIVRNMSVRMFGTEGYLTHTLPVHTWELLGGKALGTWLFGVFMVGVAIASVLLLFAFTMAGSGNILNLLKVFIGLLPKLGPAHFRMFLTGAAWTAYSLAAFLAWSLVMVVQFQFICIAARQFGKYHIAGGVIVFVLLLRAETWVNSALSAGFLVSLLFAAGCFWGSSRLLKKHLSL